MSASSSRLMLAFTVGALLAGCSKQSGSDGNEATSGEPPTAVEVTVAKVIRQDVTEGLDVSGALQALPGRDVKLGALTAGRVAQVEVAEGDAVKQGQPLLWLEPTLLNDALAQAQANAAQARAERELAGHKLASAAAAFEAGVAARQEVEDARAAQVAAESALKSAEAAVSTASNALQRSKLRAPFDGQIAHVFVSAGEPVDPGRPLVEIVDNAALELRAGVSARDAAGIRVGMPAQIRVEGVSQSFPGQVVAVSPVVDSASGLVTVRIRVENSSGALKAGTAAQARIILAEHKGALTVPQGAVVPLVQGESAPAEAAPSGPAHQSAVEKVDAQEQVHRVPVVLGASFNKWVEVRSGLAEGDRIVAEGAYALPDGTRVIPARAPDGGAR